MTTDAHGLGMSSLKMQGGDDHTRSFAPKTPGDSLGFSQDAFHSAHASIAGYSDRHPQRSNVQPINTGRIRHRYSAAQEMQTPQTGYDMNFTPLLPSQLLMGSPFQPGSPSFQSTHFQSFPHQDRRQNERFHQHAAMSPPAYHSMASPTGMGASSFMGGLPSPTTFSALGSPGLSAYRSPAMQLNPALASGSSRTVYLGNIPPDTTAEEMLSHVRSGQIESVRLLPDKNCAFISFLDSSAASHFHSDAILKKLSIKGQDIKVGWGKPSSVPTSVALAVQQSNASRNVYLGNLPEGTTEEELREDLSKFGPIDTVKIVREKAIGFVHFLSIGNAIKAVAGLPQLPKWQPPRKVYYGKDRCAYVSKTQQQNAAQYLGIAPGYAHTLNGTDRELISNALAQQSVAAAAVATTAGGINNLGNRTVYLGNIHPETTIEEICNVVRGGLLHHIRYIPDKHICFVTFIDSTAAASFYALSNLQGLMIHNRRLKVGWGKHSGALPPAIALAVSGGASRNVYVGNLDETWTEDRLRQDFKEYGEIELVNTLREKSCAFVNFTNIANAIKAIEGVRGKEEYKRFKVNFGKDRCGNQPRQTFNGPAQQQHREGPMSPTNGVQNRPQQSISPANGGNLLRGPTASTIFNFGNNNPLTMYLAAQQNAQANMEQMQQQFEQIRQDDPSPQPLQHQQHGYIHQLPQSVATQQAFYSSPNEVTMTRSAALEPLHHHVTSGHISHQSVNISNGMNLNPFDSKSAVQRSHHNRAVSLPAFSLQQAQQQQQQQQGYGKIAGGYSPYGMIGESGLPGWAEEDAA
ncbi:hypothetical protein K470DRAFT_256011 [Piedraia hortae CBS 480.64]|uniref:RRM domain-containing protein n=1 Tax=Piedraia hortae CBS 480.64 TaxID=1314780 RepID=A0A6A7C5X3_9PEZI|nr:hypothetical protein K470DRAFT_256011 [Piedraia hortae CBS 480.64]